MLAITMQIKSWVFIKIIVIRLDRQMSDESAAAEIPGINLH
jgi:hypothetical protein